MRLVDLVKIDHRFEKSVNLLLDLNDKSKLKLYIPTRSSVKLLKEYLDEVDSFSGKRANILIGPYGKGKSHLLLVLMAMLSGVASEELENLITRIETIDVGATKTIGRTYKKKKLLPVIINPNSGTLAQAFVRSLSQALRHEELLDVVPDSYFSEALHIIGQWKQFYKPTYDQFQKELGDQKKSLLRGLKSYDYTALNKFREIYPKLTSGSTFNPVVDDEVLSVYRSVNRLICEKYGYDGIYIIFDEFSKYIEGHSEEGFSSDMKILQDICELCNSSKEEQLHLTCVAHKAIRSYGDSLSKEIKNAFQGVEGRLTEMPFVVSSQNNYELIADAIQKKAAFSNWKTENSNYAMLLEDSYQIRELTSLFEENDFEEIVMKGAFPLTPLAALLLLALSEKIAQNERTVFTFLTGKDLYSLATYVEKCRNTEFVGADLIYDYFSQLLSEEKDMFVHNEWLKAEYALKKTEDGNERKILKAMAVIRMVNHTDSMAVNDKFLRLATGLDKETCKNTIESLRSSQMIEFKPGQKAYDFKNSIGIDIEGTVSDCAKKSFSKIQISDVLNRIIVKKYILPKKYNQDHYMTRYVKIYVMTAESFLALSSVKYIPKENDPDGYLFVIVDGLNETEINQHLEELNDNTVSVAAVSLKKECGYKAKMFLATEKLLKDNAFISENGALKTELENWNALLTDELNEAFENAINDISNIYTLTGSYKVGDKGLNRAISDFVDQLYTMTPIINNEMINRHNVTAQTSKARNVIVDDIFHSRNFDKYARGTSAESTIYRACMIHTKEDENLQNVRRIITEFIQNCKGKKGCFASLVDELTKPPIGMRKGVMPIYIAEQIMQLEDMPVIYHDKTEIALDAKLMSDVTVMPEKHYLFVEEETAVKLEYIQGLENMFAEYGEYCREIENMNRLARLKCYIQAWYRSLPQAAIIFQKEDFEGQAVKELVSFRRLLVGEPNPRELIFEQIPKAVKATDLKDALRKTERIKKELDSHVGYLKKRAESIVRKVLGLSSEDNFRLSLQYWYNVLPSQAQNSVFPADIQGIFNAIRNISAGETEIGGEVIEQLSKTSTNFFIEDWTDKTIQEFEDTLQKLVAELDKKKNDTETGSKITLATDDGIKECFYDFDPDDLSTSGYFFQNALEEMLDEYGSSMDNNEKIGILMRTVKKLMGE